MNSRVSTSRKPLRLWPGVAFAGLLIVGQWGLPLVAADGGLYGLPLGIVASLAIIVWWLLFSRAPWLERLGALVFMVVALVATLRVVHLSIAAGAQGYLLYVLGLPTLCLALVVGAVAGRRLSAGPRRTVIAASIILACGFWTTVRTEGVVGSDMADLEWRWSRTAEERLLAETNDEPVAVPVREPAAPSPSPLPAALKEPVAAKAAPAPRATTETVAAWSGFRGPARDGTVRGTRISTDWSASPPVEIWRRKIGPGWSSFAISGDLVYTQEQRGDDEIVACYRLSTGAPVWRHRDSVRFWESNGGAGPRATPTVSNGRVYALGATGILNALDAGTGTVLWSRNAASDTEATLPGWGFAGSPLVVGDVVIVATSGTLAAYELGTGKLRWVGPKHGGTYSSPQLVTIDGVEQVLLLSPPGTVSVAPADGTLLWEHIWDGGAIVQPAITADGDVLINSITPMGGTGTRRLAVKHGPGGWTVEERWTSNGLKPYFNDFVVHKDLAFGFDGSILACIGLEDGKRKWKGGRYGNGQMVLLADQDVLLLLSEEGELALVSATPDKFTELARFKAIEGKTWNHPVLVGNVLLVRNGEEMAAFRLNR